MTEKDLEIKEISGAHANIPDLKVYGDGDTFALLCKASSQDQGWMKSTKVCNVQDGCIVQVTTQQKNPDGSYAVAEALTYVPGMAINTKVEPRRLVSVDELDVEPETIPEQDLVSLYTKFLCNYDLNFIQDSQHSLEKQSKTLGEAVFLAKCIADILGKMNSMDLHDGDSGKSWYVWLDNKWGPNVHPAAIPKKIIYLLLSHFVNLRNCRYRYPEKGVEFIDLPDDTLLYFYYHKE